MGETRQQRINRELIELLNELRVALTGVQVLFAFLLTVPFTQRFEALDGSDRRVYVLTVVAAAVSSACLVAPTAHHRLLFRQGSKEKLLRLANPLVLLGLLALAVAMSGSVYVIISLVYGDGSAAWWAGGVVLPMCLLWFAVPFALREESHRSSGAGQSSEPEDDAGERGEDRVHVGVGGWPTD